MNVPVVKFNTKEKNEFHKVLNKRVNKYFKDNQLSKNGNYKMVFKTVFMIALYFVPLFLMLAGSITTFASMLLMWVLMGFGMSGIGLSIMHDANHGSYAKSKKVNNFIGYIINFVGGYHVNWKIQHNVLHHSFTNIHEFDEDLAIGVMRFSPDQPKKSFYKYQAFYAPFFYSVMTIYWCTAKDYIQVLRYHRKDLLHLQGLTIKTALVQLTLLKAGYFLLFLILPLLLIPLPGWQIFIGFLVMHFICGLALALIFQPAHVLEETEFYHADENGSVENNWAIHQFKTTSNFAKNSKLFSWFVGGLNYQIEHHLFPHVCHVHYKDISGIVQQTAKEFEVPYYQHETFYDALKSHFTLLNQLGRGTYKKEELLVASRP